MTNQEAFARVVQGLRTQGAPSVDERGLCFYRHPDGIRRCAVGLLIPDEEYDASFEGRTVCSVKVRSLPCFRLLDIGLIQRLQDAHDFRDKKTWTTYMEAAYVEIAQCYNLVVPPHPCSEPSHDDKTELCISSECYQEA